MLRTFSKLLLTGLVLSSSTGALAANEVTKWSFSGFSAFATLGGGHMCPADSAQMFVGNSISVAAFENVAREKGGQSSSGSGVSLTLSLDQCDGSSYNGQFQLDGSGFTGDKRGVSVTATLPVERSVPTLDEWGGMVWVGTGEFATVQVSVTLTPTGDMFTGQTSNGQQTGAFTLRLRQKSTTYEATADVAVSLAGAPVDFGYGMPFGQYSQASSGQMTITKR